MFASSGRSSASRRTSSSGGVARNSGRSAIQSLIADAWSQSAIPDFAHPHTRGEPPADLDNSLRFGKGLLHLAGRDPAVHQLMIGVRQLIKPRSALGDPELVRRVTSLQEYREGCSPLKSHF